MSPGLVARAISTDVEVLSLAEVRDDLRSMAESIDATYVAN